MEKTLVFSLTPIYSVPSSEKLYRKYDTYFFKRALLISPSGNQTSRILKKGLILHDNESKRDNMTYCEYIKTLTGPAMDLNKEYHDKQYGFPIAEDNELFGRLILEINQAGLSWLTILKKQTQFRIAYDNFEIETVANYTESDETRLLSDAGIIRNKLKVKAAIHNAQVIVQLKNEHGSFKNWLDHHHPKTKEEWTKLFKKTFKFTGGEIVNEFLVSTGYLPGAHATDCPVYHEVLVTNPAWKNA